MDTLSKLDWVDWLDRLNVSLVHACYEIGEPIIQITSDDEKAAEHWLRGWTPTEYAESVVEIAYY